MAERTAYHLKISGMYCVQCEQRIARALQNLKGVHHISVSYKKAKADFESDNSVPYDSIVKAIEDEGYKVAGLAGSGLPVKGLVSLAAIMGLYVLLQYTGLLNKLAPSQLAQSGMGYGTLFLIGVVTSVHCIAMCGGISLSQSIPDTEKAAALLLRCHQHDRRCLDDHQDLIICYAIRTHTDIVPLCHSEKYNHNQKRSNLS